MASYIDDDDHNGAGDSEPRVFDGARWDRLSKDLNNLETSGIISVTGGGGNILVGGGASSSSKTKKVSPMPPVLIPFTSLTSLETTGGSGIEDDGKNIKKETNVDPTSGNIVMDGSIFVSVVSFRDSQRCGATIKSLFDEAKEPSRIVVGLVDQVNTEEHETTCIDEYCNLMGIKGGRKILKQKCPRYHQIREIGVFSKGSAGPGFARSLQRKNLSNEEFCMQVDAHTKFAPNWDVMSIEEWKATNNEYGVISTVPPNESQSADYAEGGIKQYQVPRICQTSFSAINLPMFVKQPSAGIAEHLSAPLLSHAWCAGFSVAKCHLEEAAPYDAFLPQIFDGEEFPRYARMWTRGYDVYTPTRNIVFHRDGPNPNSKVDPKGWPRRDVLRNESIKRIKTLLNIVGGDTNPSTQANMGVLGLGKRRSLDDFQTFVGVDLREGTGGRSTECSLEKWVPYDYTKYSALDNLYDHAQNLDPQPEYPLRTIQVHSILDTIARDIASSTSTTDGSTATTMLDQLLEIQKSASAGGGGGSSVSVRSSNSSGIMGNPFVLFLFWLLGIVLWYFASSNSVGGGSRSARGRGRSRNSRPGGRTVAAGATTSGPATAESNPDTNGSHKNV